LRFQGVDSEFDRLLKLRVSTLRLLVGPLLDQVIRIHTDVLDHPLATVVRRPEALLRSGHRAAVHELNEAIGDESFANTPSALDSSAFLAI